MTNPSPTTTLLDWLREERHLTGTKEGCNEGDCGACTVMLSDQAGTAPLNACILFLPQIAGKHVTTVEGLKSPDGTLHPAQTAMIEHHGSQCGFCTPGFVVSMAAAHLNGDTDHRHSPRGQPVPLYRLCPDPARRPCDDGRRRARRIYLSWPKTLRGNRPKGPRGQRPSSTTSRKTRMRSRISTLPTLRPR